MSDTEWTPPAEAVEAARSAYWAAYSEAVRNAPSNRNGQGITATDGAAAGHAGHAAALIAARPVLVAEALADAWDEGARTALDYSIRQPDGIAPRLERPNPYRDAASD